MNDNLIKLLIDVDKDDVLKQQIVAEPTKTAARYNLTEQEIEQFLDADMVALQQRIQGNGSGIIWIHASQ